jgi:hypothetical protein
LQRDGWIYRHGTVPLLGASENETEVSLSEPFFSLRWQNGFMNRRGFIGALAGAIAAPLLPQPAPAAGIPSLGCIPPGTACQVNGLAFLNVGDIVTFFEDPTQFRITEVVESSFCFQPVLGKKVSMKRSPEPPWIPRRARRHRHG